MAPYDEKNPRFKIRPTHPTSMEYDFHNWLKKQNFNRPNVLVGIGDDAAVQIIDPVRNSLVAATDTIAEGTHFELPRHSLELVGRKALAVNLSDIAAMGAKPESVVLNFQLPSSFNLDSCQALFSGVQTLADQFGIAIIGGDTNRWDGKLVVGATVLGSLPSGSKGWPIGGAKPGDAIVVSGHFGGSIHGRHLEFEPRIELASYLFENFPINAVTDASDSLSLDLHAMVKQSGLGAMIELESIPVSNDVQSENAGERIQHALDDGEDFELILALDPQEARRLLSDPKTCTPLSQIGTFEETLTDIRYLDGGETKTLQPKGYVH